MRNRLLVFSIITSFFLVSCGRNDEKFVSEGALEYAASAVDANNPMAALAPSKMIIKFKNDKSSAEMTAGMGLFSTTFISDPEKKSLTQLVKLLNKKFSLVQTEAEIKKDNNEEPLQVTPTNETKIIAGYKCQKAHVKAKDADGNPTEYDIYYTKDLNIKDPNFANPYYMIDGVLMEYQMKKFGFEMKFVATSVKKEEIDDATFELPPDFKALTAQEMKDLIQSLQ
jgi:GLPGLI family protein